MSLKIKCIFFMLQFFWIFFILTCFLEIRKLLSSIRLVLAITDPYRLTTFTTSNRPFTFLQRPENISLNKIQVMFLNTESKCFAPDAPYGKALFWYLVPLCPQVCREGISHQLPNVHAKYVCVWACVSVLRVLCTNRG